MRSKKGKRNNTETEKQNSRKAEKQKTEKQKNCTIERREESKKNLNQKNSLNKWLPA